MRLCLKVFAFLAQVVHEGVLTPCNIFTPIFNGLGLKRRLFTFKLRTLEIDQDFNECQCRILLWRSRLLHVREEVEVGVPPWVTVKAYQELKSSLRFALFYQAIRSEVC